MYVCGWFPWSVFMLHMFLCSTTISSLFRVTSDKGQGTPNDQMTVYCTQRSKSKSLLYLRLTDHIFSIITISVPLLYSYLQGPLQMSTVLTGEGNRGEMRDEDVFAFQRTLVAHIITPPWNLSIFLYHPALKSVLPRTKSECGSFQFSNYKWQVKLTKIGRSTGALPALVGKPNSNHRQQREGSSGIGLENCLFNIPSAVTNTTDTTQH